MVKYGAGSPGPRWSGFFFLGISHRLAQVLWHLLPPRQQWPHVLLIVRPLLHLPWLKCKVWCKRFDKMAVAMGEMAQVLNSNLGTRTTNCHNCWRAKATTVSLGCPLACLLSHNCNRGWGQGGSPVFGRKTGWDHQGNGYPAYLAIPISGSNPR